MPFNLWLRGMADAGTTVFPDMLARGEKTRRVASIVHIYLLLETG